MYKEQLLALYATSFAIVFTTLIFLNPKYSQLWFSLEIIVLPLIYTIGYQIILKREKRKNNNMKKTMMKNYEKLENYTFLKEKEIVILKRKINELKKLTKRRK